MSKFPVPLKKVHTRLLSGRPAADSTQTFAVGMLNAIACRPIGGRADLALESARLAE